MKHVAIGPHVTDTVAGPATTTLLIISGDIGVGSMITALRMSIPGVMITPLRPVTVTTPRGAAPILTCVKLRTIRKRSPETVIVIGMDVTTWLTKSPALAKQEKTKIRNVGSNRRNAVFMEMEPQTQRNESTLARQVRIRNL